MILFPFASRHFAFASEILFCVLFSDLFKQFELKQFAVGSYFELQFSRKSAQTSDAFQDLEPVESFCFCICKLVSIHTDICIARKINQIMYAVIYFFPFGYFQKNLISFCWWKKEVFIQNNSADMSFSLQSSTMMEKACFRLLRCVLVS